MTEDTRNGLKDREMILDSQKTEFGLKRWNLISANVALYWIDRHRRLKELSNDINDAFRETITALEAENKQLKEALQNKGGILVDTIKQKIAVLQTAGDIEPIQTSNGWICKHEDQMVKEGNNIMAYFMYFPTMEQAVDDYFNFVTKPGRTILIMYGLTEYEYDGTGFVKVAKV